MFMVQTARKASAKDGDDLNKGDKQQACGVHDVKLANVQTLNDCQRAKSAAAMARRNILLAAKGQLLDETFAAARAHICDTDYGKYRELLVALLSCAMMEQAKNEQTSIELGDEVAEIDAYEVFLNAQDLDRFGHRIVDDARRVVERRIGYERAAKLRLSHEPADIDGGLILRYGDTEANCSLSVLLAQMRREMEGRICEILFAET